MSSSEPLHIPKHLNTQANRKAIIALWEKLDRMPTDEEMEQVVTDRYLEDRTRETEQWIADTGQMDYSVRLKAALKATDVTWLAFAAECGCALYLIGKVLRGEIPCPKYVWVQGRRYMEAVDVEIL